MASHSGQNGIFMSNLMLKHGDINLSRFQMDWQRSMRVSIQGSNKLGMLFQKIKSIF